jgi:hypothetical protein
MVDGEPATKFISQSGGVLENAPYGEGKTTGIFPGAS